MGATYGDFDFFLKIPPILKIEVGFFSDRTTFAQNVFPGKFYYFGTNYERSFKRFAEHFFFPKYPRFWNLKLDFFPQKKSFFKIFFLPENLFPLNFFFKKKKKKKKKK